MKEAMKEVKISLCFENDFRSRRFMVSKI